ncbi:putative ribonuclease H protein At1g65750 family [Senna tora]|uniref:Putative ribonuclease H protein At1g65750 family n=1 Tax=Senna tora TaxID=362788 RepID=A0A834XHZ8_9FABA|nr:putative ribonuclease H protein At1g65750 family [Senna tora]
MEEGCTLCQEEEETAFHLLMECPATQVIWQAAQFDYSSKEYHTNFLEWVTVEGKEWSKEQLGMLIITACLIWEEKNTRRFTENANNLSRIWIKATMIWEELMRDTLLGTDAEIAEGRNTWVKPAPPCFKLNCDAAMSAGKRGSIGGLIRDSEGIVVAAFAIPVNHVEDIYRLEAMAIQKGVEVARDIGVQYNFLIPNALRPPCTMLTLPFWRRPARAI